MRRVLSFLGPLFLILFGAVAAYGQQIGKYVPIPAGSDADHALTAINAATDPAQKLALIDKFVSDAGQGDMAIVVDDQYVSYYLAQKNYDKAFEYGDKLFALDPNNFANAMNMIRAASEKGDASKLFEYGEKAGAILQLYKASPAPEGKTEVEWGDLKAQTLENNKDGIAYVQQSVYNAAYQTKEPIKRAEMFAKFGVMFPDSPYANLALGVAAVSYQQAQNIPKMLEVANGLLVKDPNNLGMLILLSDYYSEKGEQLDKAQTYAKKAISVLGDSKKPEGVTEEQWQQQITLQKGLAFSILGEVNLQKKDNALAVQNLQAAAPLLKSVDLSYARNQLRLGYALVNLKKNAEAKEALTQAASVNTPYKGMAQQKLQELAAAKTVRKAS